MTLKARPGILIAAVLAAAVTAASAAAQEAAAPAPGAGRNQVSLLLGLGLPLSEVDLDRINRGSERPGDAGFARGVQFLHDAGGQVAFGAEFAHTDWSDREFTYLGRDTTIDGGLLTFMGIARYLVAPGGGASPYVLGGLGLNRLDVRVRRTAFPQDVLLDTNTIGLAAAIGAGIQGTISGPLVAGAEGRYTLATTDSGKFGTSALHAMNLMTWLGLRF